jgi:cytochrome c-type biogenesis protein
LRFSSLLVLLFTLIVLLSPSGIAEDASNIENVYHTPEEPFPGEAVSFNLQVVDDANVSRVDILVCTINPVTIETINCFPPELMDNIGNRTFEYSMTRFIEGGTMMGYRIMVNYSNIMTYDIPDDHSYIHFNLTDVDVPPPPAEIPSDLIIVESLLTAFIIIFLALLIYRKRKEIKTGSNKILVVAIILLLIIGVLYATISLSGLGVRKVEDFTLNDIDENPWSLSDYPDQIVILDFMAVSCGPCEELRGYLQQVVTEIDSDEVVVISLAVGSDSDEKLRKMRDDRAYIWDIARDTVDIHSSLGVKGLPSLVIVGKDRYPTFQANERVPGTDELKKEIEAALEGTAQPISIAQVGIFATGAFLGIATYFSPCSFPMLPGFISFYMSTEVEEKKKSFRTVLSSGLISGFGIVLVFLIIGLIALVLGEAANLGDYMIYMGPIVGIILIILGALMFTNLQYHALIRPFQQLRAKIFGEKELGAEDKSGYYTKLFSYGVGYGAAASACTAPLFIAVLLAAIVAGSFVDGLIMLLIFSLTILLLMVSITLLLSAFGQESVQKLAAHTDTIKKVSGFILVIVGAYLIYYYYVTFVV